MGIVCTLSQQVTGRTEPMKKFLDIQVPFFIPLWRRIAASGATLAWAVFELAMGEPFWALLFGAIGVYMVQQFFLAWDPKGPGDGDRGGDET